MSDCRLVADADPPAGWRHRHGYTSKWRQYDPQLASKLMDEIDLTNHDRRGFPLFPMGGHRGRKLKRGERGRRRPSSCQILFQEFFGLRPVLTGAHE